MDDAQLWRELLSYVETKSRIQEPVGPGRWGTQDSVCSVCVFPTEKFQYLPPRGVQSLTTERQLILELQLLDS